MAADTQNSNLTINQHLVYICSRLLAYAVPLLFFLVTTSFYLKTYDSAQVKITFTQIGTTFILFVWISKMLLEGHLPFKKRDWVYIAPFLAYLASGLISYWHSPFKGWPIEETMRRIFYMILALVTIAEMRSDERMKRLWRWLMAAAWVSIGYGVIQYLDTRFYLQQPGGPDLFIWRQAFGYRVFSTFGNPNFYGNFLVIMTPLILASVLRGKGSLQKPFVLLAITLCLILLIDHQQLDLFFGAFDPSFKIVYSVAITVFVVLFLWVASEGARGRASLFFFLILFPFLFLNLYATETKGAWLGFTAAVAGTLFLILEYFLSLDEQKIADGPYSIYLLTLSILLATLMGFLGFSFVAPLLKGTVSQIGFSILWIPSLGAAIISALTLYWVIRRPWNLKKVVYGLLIFFVLFMGSFVLHFAKSRLTSVSFRLFTWISTWEMIETQPLLGNGVGSFKVIYPAYRRPQIIVLEGKSNTETDHSEDEYIEVWQDEGLIGFGIFLWLILTALVCGFKQLSWYSKARAPDQKKRKSLQEADHDPRSYEVLGILGAYIGALIHWSVDVSIRFVSSGIFSGLLPGLLVAYARNHEQPIPIEARLSYDRWIRAAVAAFWTGVILFLKMELVPQKLIVGGDTKESQVVFFAIVMGILIFIVLELLEKGLSPNAKIPISDQYEPPKENGKRLRWFLVGCSVIGLFFGVRFFNGFFQADVHHNLAIFFSKNTIWAKEPRFDAKVSSLPEDIKRHYRKYGGALEHYAQVIKNNPYFPMAMYFTGNVYNDRGSEKIGEAMQLREKGNLSEASRIREQALEMWEKSEKAYEDTKVLAPNYVQIHHQMGLLYFKRGDQAARWGEINKAKEYYQKAEEYFYLYKKLDPVFPPNYDRLVQIHLMDKDYETAQKLYKEAIHYNEVVAKSINPVGFPYRVSELATSLAKVFYTQALEKYKNPYSPRTEEIKEAINYFQMAADVEPDKPELWKNLGFILTQAGEHHKAQEALKKAQSLSPNDPHIQQGS